MPTAPTAPTAAATDAAPAVDPDVQEMIDQVLSKPVTAPDRQIARAIELEIDRANIGEDITANRDYIRLMEKNDELTPVQVKWRKIFYPDKVKGKQRSDDEIEATRKLKVQARKDGSSS
jgi:hypothetical protein